MNLIRYQFPQRNTWSPLDRLTSFRDEINRLFDASSDVGESAFGGWRPVLDLYDEKERFLVSVELPGLSKDAIKIELHDGVLTVSGERKHERETKEGETFRSERSFGKFLRSVSIPTAVDTTKVKATYKDGVLLVDLPKSEEAKPKQIEIGVS